MSLADRMRHQPEKSLSSRQRLQHLSKEELILRIGQTKMRGLRTVLEGRLQQVRAEEHQ